MTEPGSNSPPEALLVEPLMSIDEVAECLKISERGVYRLLASGELAPVKIGGSTRVEPEELRRFITKQRQEGYERVDSNG